MNLYRELFFEQTDVNVAKKLFKENVESIEVGISKLCNRICDYCPNSLHDRRTSEEVMDDKVFDALLSQLASIEYSGAFTIHRYNEPFYDFDYALKRIKQIKTMLPGSHFVISTNGDYLNKECLLELNKVMTGKDSVHITMHYPPGQKDFEKVKTLLKRVVKTLGFDVTMGADNAEVLSFDIKVGDNMRCEYRAINFYQEGSFWVADRGESMKLNQVITRKLPCFTTFTQMQIEYDGSLQPCCNIHPDVREHQQYSMGKFDENANIFLLYASETYAKWRNSMFTSERKASPCSTCTYHTQYDRLNIPIQEIRDNFEI
jgi:radical SAM protein with 4Fe4S-binding SPASM domain